MVNYGRKKCKICGAKLIKKGFDKANNQIWYCKHCHKHYVFKRKDIHNRIWIYRYIDFNVSKSTFYRKISKFRNTNIFLPEDRQQYDQIFVDALWLKKMLLFNSKN